jgi:hypothetical protein
MSSKFNALKTGTYARESILPWEDPAEYEKLRAEFFNDKRPRSKSAQLIVQNMVENRWLRERMRKTTALATHRHAFGEALEEAGVTNWREALTILRDHNVTQENTLQSIAQSESELAKAAAGWSQRAEASDELTKIAKKIVKCVGKSYAHLSRMLMVLDAQREFLLEYSPKHLERRIRLENLLDAQYRKLHADLVIDQEAELVRDKLRKTGGGTDDAPGTPDNPPGPPGDVDKDVAPAGSETEPASGEDELLHDDTDDMATDDWGQPIDRNNDDEDPLAKFARGE